MVPGLGGRLDCKAATRLQFSTFALCARPPRLFGCEGLVVKYAEEAGAETGSDEGNESDYINEDTDTEGNYYEDVATKKLPGNRASIQPECYEKLQAGVARALAHHGHEPRPHCRRRHAELVLDYMVKRGLQYDIADWAGALVLKICRNMEGRSGRGDLRTERLAEGLG